MNFTLVAEQGCRLRREPHTAPSVETLASQTTQDISHRQAPHSGLQREADTPRGRPWLPLELILSMHCLRPLLWTHSPAINNSTREFSGHLGSCFYDLKVAQKPCSERRGCQSLPGNCPLPLYPIPTFPTGPETQRKKA